MFKLHDRVKETSYTQGTGNLLLREAVAGFRTFSSVYADGDTFFYCIAGNVNYEIGLGRYVSAGNQIQRVELFDSSTGSLINWGQGLKEIYVTYTAVRSVYSDGSLSGDMVALVSDRNSLTGDEDFTYGSGTLRVPTVEVNDLTAPTIYTESVNFEGFASDQVEPFLRNSLADETGIDNVILVSGEVDQLFGLVKQNPAKVFAGPLNNCSGVCEDDYPSFRPLTAEDIPTIQSQNINYSPSSSGDWDTQPTNVRQALDILSGADNYLDKSLNFEDVENKALARFHLGVSPSGDLNGKLSNRLASSINTSLGLGVFELRASGDIVFIDANISGTILTLQLGQLT